MTKWGRSMGDVVNERLIKHVVCVHIIWIYFLSELGFVRPLVTNDLRLNNSDRFLNAREASVRAVNYVEYFRHGSDGITL
jgi:hypothetical protein